MMAAAETYLLLVRISHRRNTFGVCWMKIKG